MEGNQHKMLEALEKIAHYCDNEHKMDDPYCQDGRTLAKIAQAALSAPARNCDIPYANHHELWLRWQNYCSEIWPSDISFSSWLLAPAAERKGADGNGR